jgi:hypothetical protein
LPAPGAGAPKKEIIGTYFPVILGLNIHIYALRATTYTTDNTGEREQTNKPREGGGLLVREEAGGIDGRFPRTLPPEIIKGGAPSVQMVGER